QTGATLQERMSQTKRSAVVIGVEESALFERLMKGVAQNRAGWPLLFQLLPKGPDCLITYSTRETYAYIQQQLNTATLSRVRKLKESTVCDHLFEIAAVLPYAPLDYYLPYETQAVVHTLLRSVSTRKLSTLKHSLPEHIDYLQLRLATARFERSAESEG
ncbi:MAG: helix-turn-helix domain-containing protein, partial [Bacilli bacterium]